MTWPAIVPTPTSMTVAGDWFALGPATSIGCDAGAEECAELLREYLGVTGLPLPPAAAGNPPGIALRFLDPDPVLGDEGYRLDAEKAGVVIGAASVVGLLHGIQTLRQLLPPEVYGPTVPVGVDWRIPCVRIADAPRLPWRGSLLDVARWFLPMEFLHRYVETLAAHKMNRLQLHLTDDQGWRFEVHRYPRLAGTGAWRAESQLGHETDGRHDGRPHGGYYTQRELSELVAFAARRGIEVVPEIDMPGHVTAAIAAYPRLGNSAQPPAVSRSWGIHSRTLNLDDTTLRFFENVLDELVAVFPSPWVHIGGDECPTTEWETSRAVADRMRKLGLSDVTKVQEWFTNHMCAHLRASGRTPIVWDEAATERLDANSIVMAWNDEAVGIKAAQAGHQVIMSPMQRTYFDWYQSDEPGQPVAHDGLTTLRDVFDYDPSPPALPQEVRARIIGTQGQMWGEYLPTPQLVENMAFPRMCALAERAWSQPDTDYADFLRRLATHSLRLRAAGVTQREN